MAKDKVTDQSLKLAPGSGGREDHYVQVLGLVCREFASELRIAGGSPIFFCGPPAHVL